MAGASPKQGILRLAKTGGALLVAWLFAWSAAHFNWIWHARQWTEDAIYRVFAGFPAIVVALERLLTRAVDATQMSYGAALAVATMAIPAAFALRLVARARIRAGHPDPLDWIRTFVSTRTKGTRALLVGPSLLWALVVLRAITWNEHDSLLLNGVLASVCGLAEWWLLRAGLRLFLEPTLDGGPASALTVREDEIVFDAVAVTRETVGAIALMALLPVAFVVWGATVKITRLYTDRYVFEAILGYVAVAISGAALFKRASRVAIGIDGVRVYGTSRTRFFAFRDLDEARFRSGDLELVRNGRVLIRLQLHGEDAARRDAVLDRITERVASSRDPSALGAQRMVEVKSTDEVVRATMGGGGYRAPSVTRDELWRLVEGSTTDATSRTAAAEALAKTCAPGEGQRLRVAAEKCADVRARVVLETIAESMSAEDDAAIEAMSPRSAAAEGRARIS
jgi:hypothetical protein